MEFGTESSWEYRLGPGRRAPGARSWGPAREPEGVGVGTENGAHEITDAVRHECSWDSRATFAAVNS
eukprot:8591246-Alexandrium_andersonii.AAC.1